MQQEECLTGDVAELSGGKGAAFHANEAFPKSLSLQSAIQKKAKISQIRVVLLRKTLPKKTRSIQSLSNASGHQNTPRRGLALQMCDPINGIPKDWDRDK